MKTALLAYNDSINIGDEIQNCAAERLLGKVDAYVDREALHTFDPVDKKIHHIILNGWFMEKPFNWPPSPYLHPLITSFHLTEHVSKSGYGLSAREQILAPGIKEYLKPYAPIGARDKSTAAAIKASGIAASFSGCLTLTLERDPKLKRTNTIYLVDLDDELTDHFLAINKKARRLTHYIDIPATARVRRKKAENLLHAYQTAQCVVTSRLHCFLPCLAFGTPVLFIPSAHDTYRFTGLQELGFHASKSAILHGEIEYDINSPPQNPTHYKKLKRRLKKQVADFLASDPPKYSTSRLDEQRKIQLTLQTITQQRLQIEQAKSRELADRHAQTENNMQHYTALLGSTSWKITAPLRKVRSKIRKAITKQL